MMINKAQCEAARLHFNQKRKFSNLPYVSHPINVAKIIEDMKGSKNMICAAFLHDVIEDCGVTYEYVDQEFNKEIAYMVRHLTNDKDEMNKYGNKGVYIGVKINNMPEECKTIKLADRLDNIRDTAMGNNVTPSFVKKYYVETHTIASMVGTNNYVNQILLSMIFSYLDYISIKYNI